MTDLRLFVAALILMISHVSLAKGAWGEMPPVTEVAKAYVAVKGITVRSVPVSIDPYMLSTQLQWEYIRVGYTIESLDQVAQNLRETDSVAIRLFSSGSIQGQGYELAVDSMTECMKAKSAMGRIDKVTLCQEETLSALGSYILEVQDAIARNFKTLGYSDAEIKKKLTEEL